MSKLAKALLSAATILAASLIVPIASAQRPGDFPAFKGFGTRTGKNAGNPISLDTGPGAAYLTWFAPRGFRGASITVDNTDLYTYDGRDGGLSLNHDPNTAAVSIPSTTNIVTYPWTAPASISEAANPTYRPYNFVKDISLGLRSPLYSMNTTVASADDSDPTAGATASWTYRFFGPAPTPGQIVPYAISVQLPIGPTQVAGVAQYPARYYIYKIKSAGKTWIDIVDTYAAGSGWVRLGGGGSPTNAVYPYDGVNPIEVTLYNTVPRYFHLHPGSGDHTVWNKSEIGRLVYADAARVTPTSGFVQATPVSADINRNIDNPDQNHNISATAFIARNEYSISLLNGANTVAQGVLAAYHTSNLDPDIGKTFWKFTPTDYLAGTSLVDNTAFTTSAGWTVDTTTKRYAGADCLTMLAAAAITDTATTTRNGDGDKSYGIYVYSPGDYTDAAGDHKFAKGMIWQVREAGVWSNYTVDMSVPGWKQIGTRRFNNSVASDLSVAATNGTSVAQDVVDGRIAYADAVRFTTDANLTFVSTPVYVGGAMIKPDPASAPVAKNIVIAADEAGRLHCVDANGNGDGTTTEYWSYPSTPDLNNAAWTDPNAVAGEDGVGNIADLPSAFNLSSAAVNTNAGKTVLYVAGTNGRIYCIDVTGRGDFNATTHLPGTTRRVWTYPATYPSANAVATSSLGAFSASIVVGGTPAQPWIYAPASQGRIYCLDGNGLPLDKSTNVRWTYPSLNRQPLGSIIGTPSLEFGNLYFGTEVNTETPKVGDAFESGFGAFYALDMDLGTLNWWHSGVINPSFESFVASPCVMSYAELGDPVTPGGLVCALNDDGNLYAFDALSGNTVWQTSELAGVAVSSLTFTGMKVYGNNGSLGATPTPVVLAALQDGRFTALFAKPSDLNLFNTRRAWQFNPVGRVTSSLAVANGFMFGADESGYVYAFSDVKGTFGADEFVPGSTEVVENNPIGNMYRKARIKFITKAAYDTLEDDNMSAAGQAKRSYAYITSNGINSTRNPAAFEWGEMLYAVVYNMPDIQKNPAGNDALPATVEFSVSFPGGVTTSQVSELRHIWTSDCPAFRDAFPVASAVDPTSFIPYPLCDWGNDGSVYTDKAHPYDGGANPSSFPPNANFAAMNGYALLAFRIQGNGQNALLPGQASVTFTVKTSALTTNGNVESIAPNPNDTFGRRSFFVANPLGVAMGLDNNGQPTDMLSIGNVVNPSDPQAIQNGSRNIASTPKAENRLLSSAGVGSHGSTSSNSFWVFDRSFMSLIRPNDATSKTPTGLDFVRIHRRDLNWQGGSGTVRKPFDPVLYPNFEDLPVNFPNTSLDYRNIGQDSVTFTKDPNGTAENPVFSGVSLFAPVVNEGGTIRPLKESDDPLVRILRPTEFKFAIDVPKYQPANTMVDDLGNVSSDIFLDSAGQTLPQGYRARFDAFVDSDQSGRFGGTVRRAYRSFSLSLAVAFDERLVVTTPQVDLGSLPGGAGLTGAGQTPFGTAAQNGAASVWSANFGLSPWASAYSNQFQSFGVRNEGNVNLLNLRLAHADATRGSTIPWYLASGTNDSLAWFDSTIDLWSDLDQPFHPDTTKNVVLQKPRVGDVVGTSLSVNPTRRANTNLGTTGTTVIGGKTYPDVLVQTLAPGGGLLFPPAPPKVGVTVPIGFPAGQYGQVMRVIEKQDTRTNNFWEWITTGKEAETASDPTFTLLFNSRETRLTNRNTTKAGVMIDNSLDPNWPNNPSFAANGAATPVNTAFAYQNMQPAAMRDAYGSLVVAWSSDRPANASLRAGEASINPGQANVDGRYRLNIATLANSSTFGQSSFTTPVAPITQQSSPIRDLDFWTPNSNSQWFNQAVSNYPTGNAATIFGAGAIDGTETFGGANFPNSGEVNAFDRTITYQATYMGFVGNVQRQTASGRQNESYEFLALVSPQAGGGLTASAPVAVPGDVTSLKGRPSLVQSSTGAMVFYPSLAGGKKGINYVRFAGGKFGPVSALPFSTAFDSVDAPSATGRPYVGVTAANRGGLVELTFSGRVKGRPAAEIFSGHLRTQSAASLGAIDRLPENVDGTLQSDLWIPQTALFERLAIEANGTYRARGIDWVRDFTVDPMTGKVLTRPVQIYLYRAGSLPRSVLMDGFDAAGNYTAANDTRRFDPQTGLMTYRCWLGGQVYIDPALGTIRFSSAVIDKSSELRATYQPRFMRVSTSTQGTMTQPSGLYDGRPISNINFWRTANNNPVTGAMAVTNDRMVFTYNRSAVGSGQGARPLMTTWRLGVKVNYSIAVINGYPQVSVAGAIGPYQVDPANARIYFTAVDEDNPLLTVTYTGVSDVNGGTIPNQVEKVGPVSWIQERAEELLPIEQAANESGLTAFLDPFGYFNQRRPPLMWMFWTSTRGGVPDIYFQTVAPQFSPVP